MADYVSRFLLAASKRPLHLAVKRDGEQVTYGDLEARVRKIAESVAKLECPRVAIALGQGTHAYAAMLGVALGGGVYAPINVEAPLEKRRRVIKTFEPDLIISSEEEAALLHAGAPAAGVLTPSKAYAGRSLQGEGRRHKLAYVIFTSGSSGVPKGVAIPRIAVDHYVDWAVSTLGIIPSDIVSQHPSIAFDLSVMDIMPTLCSGATLCPISNRGDRLLPARAVAREQISVWISVPSVIGLMMRAGQLTTVNLRSLRLLGFCGEPLLPSHVEAIFAACPTAAVVNTYGPTETTVSMTAVWLTQSNLAAMSNRSISIGEPIEGMQIHLLDGTDNNNGEIAISGPQLALGYWNDKERTDSSFKSIEINNQETRVYFTGDWAERRGAQYWFRNRLDWQIKVRGYRLELDEVAEILRSVLACDVCVLFWKETIVAFVEIDDLSSQREQDVRRILQQKLEPHAIPGRIIAVPQLPRNANDKIDRIALGEALGQSSMIQTPLDATPSAPANSPISPPDGLPLR